MKYILQICFLLFYSVLCNGQNSSHHIGILPIKYEAGNEDLKSAATQITDLVYNYFIQNRLAKIVEREYFNDLKTEKFLTSDIDFVDGVTYSKTKSVGAQSLLVGKISGFKIDKNDQGYYKCKISVGVRLIDVETGQIKESYTFENKEVAVLSDLTNFDKTPGSAITTAISKLNTSIEKFAKLYFPVEYLVKEIVQNNGNKAEVIEVRVGSSKGAQAKQRYLIKERTIEEGEVNYSTVGEVTITEVNGANLSTAKVTKGGDIIKSKIDKGATLVAIPK